MAISSSFKTKCPGCAGLVLIKDPKLIGRKVECPKCKNRFVVADPTEVDKKAVAEEILDAEPASDDAVPTPVMQEAPPAPAKKEAVAAGPPKAAVKPAAKAPPPPPDDEDEDEEEAPKAKTSGKTANGKATNGKSSQIKAAGGKAAPKGAPADEDEKPKGKAAAKRFRDEDDEDEDDEKSKGKKKKKSGKQGSSKMLVGVGLAVVGVAILGAAAYFLFIKKDGPSRSGGTDFAQQKQPNPINVAADPNNKGENTVEGSNPAEGTNPGENNPPKNIQGDKQPNPTPGATTENPKTPGGNENVAKASPDKEPAGNENPPPVSPPRASGEPAGVEITNLLPKGTQGVFQLNFKEFLESPMGVAAFQRSGAFNDQDLRRRVGFWVTSLDRIIVAENYADGWAFSVLHTQDPIDKLDNLKAALGLKQPKERAIRNQEYFEITRSKHWLANLGRLSLGAPAHIRNAQPPGPNPPPPLYLRLHNRQTIIVAHLQPMREFLQAEGHFPPYSGKAILPANPGGSGGAFPPGQQPPGAPGQPPMSPPGYPPPGAVQPPGSPATQPPMYRPSYQTPTGGAQPPGSPTKQPTPMSPRYQPPGGSKSPMPPGEGSPTPPMPGVGGYPMNPMPGAGGQPAPAPGAEGQPNPGAQPPPRPSETYITINPSLKGMLDEMARQADESERVIFISATNMGAARVVSRNPEEKNRVLWRVRPVWDVTDMLHEKTERITVLGTGLHMKDQMNYVFKNAMACSTPDDAKALRADLRDKVAPDLARLLRYVLNGHTVEVVKEAAPAAPNGGPFPPGQFPPGQFPPGQFPPGQFPPGQAPPGGNAGEKEEVKHSQINVTQNEREVLFRLDLKLNQPAYQAMTNAMQVVMIGLRGEIDVAEGAARRHDLAAAGKRLGEQGLSNRGVLPGNYPPGAFKRNSGQRSARDPGQRISWMAGLLPYMGHKTLFNRIDFEKSWKDPANWLAARTVVPEFIDPTFPKRVRYAAAPGLPLEAAATHYVGLAGIGLDAAEYPASDPALVNKLGVFGYDRAASLKEIGEGRGLSNTILMIRTPYNGPAGVTPWMAGGGSTVRSVPEKDSAEPFFSNDPDGSRGTFVLMVDGSVRYIKKGISDEAFKAMVTVRGPAPADFDIDTVAPKVEPPQQEELPQIKDEPRPAPPPQPKKAPTPNPGGVAPPASNPGGGQTAKRNVYSPPGGRCTVEFPAGTTVKTENKQIPLPTGQNITLNIHGIDQGQDAMAVMFADYPPGLVPAGQEDTVLDGAGKGMVMNVPGAKITSEKKIMLDRYPGRDYTLKVGAQGDMRGRIYLVGNRMYILLVVGSNPFANSADANHFLQSLKLQGGAPAAAPPNPGGGQPFPGGGQPGVQPAAGQAISAVDLVRAYQANRAAADKQYTNQTVTVQGRVGGRKENAIVLETGLRSILPGAAPGATDVVEVHFRNPGDANRAAGMGNITVQGRCTGFNQILDVVLTDAQLVGVPNPGGGNPFPGKAPRRPGVPFPGKN